MKLSIKFLLAILAASTILSLCPSCNPIEPEKPGTEQGGEEGGDEGGEEGGEEGGDEGGEQGGEEGGDEKPLEGTIAAWNDGATLTIAGREFDKQSGLTAIYVSADSTIATAVSASAYFVSKDAKLTIAKSASFSNCIIVSNDLTAHSSLDFEGPVTLKAGSAFAIKGFDITRSGIGASNDEVFIHNSGKIGFFGLDDCSFDFPTTLLAPEGTITETAIECCNWKVSADMIGIFNGLGVTSTAFKTLRIRSNIFHTGSNSTTYKMKLLQNANGLTFDEVDFCANMFINIKGSGDNSGLVQAGGTSYLYLVNNIAVWMSGELPNNFFLYRSAPAPTNDYQVAGNKLYYFDSGYTAAKFCPYWFTTPNEQGQWSASVDVKPFGKLDAKTGKVSFSGPACGISARLADGLQRFYDADSQAGSVYLRHNQTFDGISSIRALLNPGIQGYTANGDWGAKSICVDKGSESHTYQILSPDVVAASDKDIPSGWNLQWADEFNAPVDYQGTWYRCARGDASNGWNRAFDPEESLVEVKSGALYLNCKKVSDTSRGYKGYVSGALRSNNLVWFRLAGEGVTGRIDVKAACTLTGGFWPAIWMMAQGVSRETGGEIDILEYLCKYKTAYQTLHTPYSIANGDGGAGNGSQVISDPTQYHIYSVVVEDGVFKYLIDGKATYTYSKASNNTKQKYPFEDYEYYFILSAQLGGPWPGDPDGTGLPGYMAIDYIRYYTK
ncbi:MAG: glycoside hydrolase family 16 protein [Bacteroidales bacterium]|nr:glycoside hydrolase family 16 protein [Candidatus Cryptobacteroides aphodequi]